MLPRLARVFALAGLLAWPAGPVPANEGGGGGVEPKEVVVPRRSTSPRTVVPKNDPPRFTLDQSVRLGISSIVDALFEEPWDIATGEPKHKPKDRRVTWQLAGLGGPTGTLRLLSDGRLIFRANGRNHEGTWTISPNGTMTWRISVLDNGEPRSGRVVANRSVDQYGEERIEYDWAGFIFTVEDRR